MANELTQADHYPAWLEAWWKNRACRLWGATEFAAIQRPLEKEIQRLSDLFTTGREARFGDYGRDEKLLLAYGVFYFPQTFARIRFPLREALLLRGWRPAGDRLRLLDLGSGLGGATLGTALLLQDMPSISGIDAVAADQSTSSLATLRQLAEENKSHLPQINLQTRAGDLKNWFRKAPQDERWDLILASFSLGEAFFEAGDEAVYQWFQEAVSRLHPGGLLLITEPSLRETSERIERLRDRIAAEGSARIWAPCPHHQRCPLLATGKFWCHEVRGWQVPESLEFLNRHLFRAVRDLKFSFILAGPPPAPGASPDQASPHFMRLVSPIGEMKGRYLWAGCAADGERHDYEIQKRDLSRDEQRRLQETERGDLMNVVASQILGNDHHRRVKSLADLRIWSQRNGREAAWGR